MINLMLNVCRHHGASQFRAVELDLEGGVAVGQDAAVRKYQVRLVKAQGPWRPAAPGSRGVGRLGRAGRPAIQLTRSMPPLASKVETRPHSTA